MNKPINLTRAEKDSFRLAAYSDGTTDLSMGLIFALLGIFPLTRQLLGPTWNAVIFLVLLGSIVVAQGLIRKRLAPSRIGIVTFGPRIKNRVRIALLINIILAAAMIVTWALAARGWFPGTPTWLGQYGFEILVSLIVLFILWGIAYALDLKRYYLYGVLLAAGFPLQASLSIYEGTPWLAAGGIIFSIGIYLLIRFLNQYPPQAVGEVV